MNKKTGGLAAMAREVSKQGRGGDTQLAHINPAEAELLRAVGGSGTINPATGLPEYKFGLGKLKNGISSIANAVGNVVSKPIGLANDVANDVVGAAIKLPLQAFSGVTGVGTGGLQRLITKPVDLVGNKLEGLADMAATGAVRSLRTPLDFATGAANLAANPSQQLAQIGRETGRTALSPALPAIAGFVPGVGPALAAGIGAAQGAYRGRNDGLLGILGNAALSGGAGYLGGTAAQNLGNAFAPSLYGGGSAAGAGAFDLGSGSGSIANELGLNLSGQSVPVAQGFNLGTGAGSISGFGGAGGFNLGTGAGSIANELGLNLSSGVVDAAGNGASNLLNDALRATNMGGGQDGVNFGALAGLLGGGGLAALLASELGKDQGSQPAAPTPQTPYGFDRPTQSLDWQAIRDIAQQRGLSPAQVLARNLDSAYRGDLNLAPQGDYSGYVSPTGLQPQHYAKPGVVPQKLAHGGLAHLARGGGSGRADTIPAKLSDGEYVMDAETVALLGDGSTDEGARKLEQLRRELRIHKGKKLAKGKISHNAKSPLAYIGGIK